MIVSLLYQASRQLLSSIAAVLLRRGTPKDAELVALKYSSPLVSSLPQPVLRVDSARVR
jgi:hypothetical protein